MWRVLLVVLGLPAVVVVVEATFRQPPPLCKTEPKWTVADVVALDEYRGSVVVLLTIELHCEQCRHQLMQ